jgi:hypothetical protein
MYHPVNAGAGRNNMAKWNKEKRVLDHEHTKFWRYEVKDVEQPNLQKDVFPYDEVCRIVFDHKLVSMSPAEDIFITDTTFRDGQQARPPYTVQQIADLYRMMNRLGGERASSARPSSSSTASATGRPWRPAAA